jgi:Na+/phosphate symporter
MPDNPAPDLRSRINSLVLGGVYLALVTAMYQQLSGLSAFAAAASVLIGSAAIIAVIAVFCAKWVSRPARQRRVKLGTLFLLFIPASIYLALLSQIFQVLPKEMVLPRWIVVSYFVLFVALTTVVLLYFGEAVVWLLLRAHRAITEARRADK